MLCGWFDLVAGMFLFILIINVCSVSDTTRLTQIYIVVKIESMLNNSYVVIFNTHITPCLQMKVFLSLYASSLISAAVLF